MGQVINIFFVNISIIYLVLSLTLYLMRHVLPIQPGSPYAIRIWFGLAMGLTAVLLTINSFQVGAGRIDLRIIPLALAAAYTGPLGVGLTVAVTFIGRMVLDGMVGRLYESLATIVAVISLSVLVTRFGLRRGHIFASYIVFGMLLVLIQIIGNVDGEIFLNVFVPYFLMTFLGGLMCYWVAKQIESHLYMFRLHAQRATIDELTGLPNRYMTLERLNEVELSGLPWALFVIDVDRFKQLNDTYGHRAGDAALYHVAQTLQTNCPRDGFVGRYGGEEFLMVLEDVKDVKPLADEIVAVVRDTPFSFEGKAIPVTISIGVSVAVAEPGTLVFERADAALYEAKTTGRNKATLG